jgi:hypothetical protein
MSHDPKLKVGDIVRHKLRAGLFGVVINSKPATQCGDYHVLVHWFGPRLRPMRWWDHENALQKVGEVEDET